MWGTSRQPIKMQMQLNQLEGEEPSCESPCLDSSDKDDASDYSSISFLSEVPAPLQAAMTNFIEHHPNWDQYRLIQAALAGFLIQNGVDSRPVTRLYLDNMFSNNQYQKK